MQLLMLILNKVDCLPDITAKLFAAGIHSTSILDCEGALHALYKDMDEPPLIYGSLRQSLNRDQTAKILLSVLAEDQVPTAKKIIDEAVGGIQNPNTGIVVTLPISSVEGLAK